MQQCDDVLYFESCIAIEALPRAGFPSWRATALEALMKSSPSISLLTDYLGSRKRQEPYEGKCRRMIPIWDIWPRLQDARKSVIFWIGTLVLIPAPVASGLAPWFQLI